jgi:hypothetical protein
MLVVALSFDPSVGLRGPPHNVPPQEVRDLYEPLGLRAGAYTRPLLIST